jgi:putative transcriptional regulator
LKGQLLLASPALFDPNFRRTVVLVTEHNEEGAAGLVLNRRSETAVADAVPNLIPLVPEEELVYVGGPVQQSAVLVLAEFDDPEDAATQVFGPVGVLDPERPDASVRRLRAFSGYAGWGPGQLETELEQDAWFLAPAQIDDPFADEDLWPLALRRKGGRYALLARMPADPSLN